VEIAVAHGESEAIFIGADSRAVPIPYGSPGKLDILDGGVLSERNPDSFAVAIW